MEMNSPKSACIVSPKISYSYNIEPLLRKSLLLCIRTPKHDSQMAGMNNSQFIDL